VDGVEVAGAGEAVPTLHGGRERLPGRQADNRFRPRARRRFRIMRPARGDMRARKPCLRFRRRTLGWDVRFISVLLGWTGAGRRPAQKYRERVPVSLFHSSGKRRKLQETGPGGWVVSTGVESYVDDAFFLQIWCFWPSYTPLSAARDAAMLGARRLRGR